ncbi:replication-relaxation family protein [Leifsonia sp. H3M29-4]|uniref:replication-relaxation family protein n=1 Tax=Salinibacterium metalliresistens TaxID=3031321 RepID=UPI0023DBEFE5|nr:replication-relaxation family protein [Salinibacterium metalliresistens]MDF1478770.1 replication-relaxation family protein [Salinibacterium metalliresistens]
MTALRLHVLELHLTDRDIRILEDLEQFRLLTTRQIQRLHLPAKPFGDHATASAATRGTTRILTRLEGLGAVARLERRIGGLKHGSALTVWHLGGAGERFLRARRGDSARRRYSEPGRTFMAHTLAVGDIAVLLRERTHTGRFELLELAAEPSNWRPFTAPGGTAITLKPDLTVVTADARTETHSFVEIDCGTEHLPVVIRKCRLYQQYFATGIEQDARGLFPAVVWLVPTTKRADAIRAAITADGALDASLFWVALAEQALDQLAPYESKHHP